MRSFKACAAVMAAQRSAIEGSFPKAYPLNIGNALIQKIL
jgi:hypothetical protein